MNFNPYIYILYYQSNLLNYLLPNPISYSYKMKCFICNRGVVTAWYKSKKDGKKTRENNVLRYVNDVIQTSINKDSYWLIIKCIRSLSIKP